MTSGVKSARARARGHRASVTTSDIAASKTVAIVRRLVCTSKLNGAALVVSARADPTSSQWRVEIVTYQIRIVTVSRLATPVEERHAGRLRADAQVVGRRVCAVDGHQAGEPLGASHTEWYAQRRRSHNVDDRPLLRRVRSVRELAADQRCLYVLECVLGLVLRLELAKPRHVPGCAVQLNQCHVDGWKLNRCTVFPMAGHFGDEFAIGWWWKCALVGLQLAPTTIVEPNARTAVVAIHALRTRYEVGDCARRDVCNTLGATIHSRSRPARTSTRVSFQSPVAVWSIGGGKAVLAQAILPKPCRMVEPRVCGDTSVKVNHVVLACGNGVCLIVGVGVNIVSRAHVRPVLAQIV